MNEKALGFFKELAKSPKQESVKLAANTDYSDLDSKFILKYANQQSSLLDLGSGSGLIVNRLYPFVNSITCIECIEPFTQFIHKSKNITIEHCDLLKFESDRKFDIITAFGVMHYMNEQESIKIYSKYREFLKPNGKFIIKNQFGIKETINVSGYSEEQKRDYYSQYRYIEWEKQTLQDLDFQSIEICDYYPKEANRWENTHFYAIVACVGDKTISEE